MKFLAKIMVATTLAGGTLVLASAGPATALNPPVEDTFLQLVNQERAANGLPALVLHAQLAEVARAWTDKMVGDGTISHNPNLVAQAPAGWLRLGENVGMGGNPQSLHQAFMGSAGHRANVLGDFNQVGVGVSYAPNGTLFVTVDFVKVARVAAAGGCGPATNPAGAPSAAAAAGYYVLGTDGGIFSYGAAPFRGSVPGLGVRAEAILMAVTPSQQGYWVLGADGGIFSFGDARFFGSLPGVGVRARAIDLKPTPSGNGYWVLGADGGIFSFGDAGFFGSLPGVGVRVRTQAIKLVPTPSGGGYWVLGADGGIFGFGDAGFFGSLPGVGVANRSVSMAVTPTGGGYWVLGADGGIFSFGDARFFGSVPGAGECAPVTGVQIVRTSSGRGYYVLSDRGSVYAFGDAPMHGAPAGLGVTTRDLAVVTG